MTSQDFFIVVQAFWKNVKSETITIMEFVITIMEFFVKSDISVHVNVPFRFPLTVGKEWQ